MAACLKHEPTEVAKQLKAGLRDCLLGSPGNAANGGTAQEQEVGGSGPAQSGTPGLDLLAAITETPRETLTGDYGAIGRALRAYLKDMTTTARDAASGDPERLRAAQTRMQFWQDTLRAHGIAIPDAAEARSEPPSSPPTDQPLSDSGAQPQSHRPESGSIAERLRGLADEFRRRADAIAAERAAASEGSRTKDRDPSDSGKPRP